MEQYVATASKPEKNKPQMLEMYSSLYAACISMAEFINWCKVRLQLV
jgi:hypothetical protein